MKKLTKIGEVKKKNSGEIRYSKISLGFEKLDRDVFSPDNLYDRVAECGVKLARIQSGWQKTEREKGVYNFLWLDKIVDNFLERGIEPWMCLCYGNDLYTEAAKTVFGAVGCPPIFSEEEKAAWANYVRETVKRYKNKVKYFEIWNEPDGVWCWKHDPNPKELAEFSILTAKAIKEANPEAKVIGGVVCQRILSFLNTALKEGLSECIDFVSFHEYTHDERDIFEKVETYNALVKSYNPKIELIQGESGSQSKGNGHGALWEGDWTEEIQAKQLARHTIADLMTDVHFTSYFSCVDMVEVLNGVEGDVASINDWGYFGILGAEFDEKGQSTGEYYKKPSYFALQNICSVFCEDIKKCSIPKFVFPYYASGRYENQLHSYEMISGSFERDNGSQAFVYWNPTNIMTTSFESTITLEIFTKNKDLKLIDIMDGSIYEISPHMLEDYGDGVVRLKDLPIKDTPLVLTIGEFYR